MFSLSLWRDEFHARVGMYDPIIVNSCTRWLGIFKGISQGGGLTIFFKTSALHSLLTAYRMNLLSARSISLDSTINMEMQYELTLLLEGEQYSRISAEGFQRRNSSTWLWHSAILHYTLAWFTIGDFHPIM
jgi:hypothetical protein